MGFPNERDPCLECTLCISRHYLNTGLGCVDWVLRTDIMRSAYLTPDWHIHMLGAPHPPAAPPRNYRAKWERGNRARFLSVHPPHNNQCCLLCFISMNIITDPAPRLSIFDIAYRSVLRLASCRTSKGRSELLKRVLGVLLYSYI